MFHKKKQRKILPLISIVFSLIALVVIYSLVSNMDTIQNYLGRASGQPANIFIDTQGEIGATPRVWANFAQGGENKDYSFAPVTDQIADLNPHYIRIDHIYDFYDIVSKQDGQLAYDWTKLNTIISEIQATGATPFISLSYMPPAISSGDVTDLPVHWHEWGQVVQATIQHISGKDSLNIQNVYYEVWNEPDLFGNWKTYGEKNYLTLYSHAALASTRVTNTQNFKIGGPASTALYKNWVEQLLIFTNKNNLPIDFYSWHLYSSDLEKISDDITAYDQYLRNFPGYIFKVEPIITEWGFDSNVNPGYDTGFSAAHTIAASSMFYPHISKAFSFEIQDGLDPNNQEYWGRWGFLTHQQFGSNPKPRYTAHQWLSDLGNIQLSLSGQGTWVKGIATKDVDDNIIVLISNYDSQSRHAETFPITFQRLKDASYSLTQEILGARSQQFEIDALNSSYIHTLTLAPNSIARITLSPEDRQ